MHILGPFNIHSKTDINFIKSICDICHLETTFCHVKIIYLITILLVKNIKANINPHNIFNKSLKSKATQNILGRENKRRICLAFQILDLVDISFKDANECLY